jgi:membrane protein involved in colicin uptake
MNENKKMTEADAKAQEAEAVSATEAKAKADAEAQLEGDAAAKLKADIAAADVPPMTDADVAEAKAKAKADAQAKEATDAQADAKVSVPATGDADKLKADIAEAGDNAKAKATTSTPKKPRKAKGAAPLDAGKLRELIAVVEAGNAPTQRGNLIHRLETEEGAKLTNSEGLVSITLAGIARTASSEAKAMDLWCSAARRACMNGEAM